MIVNEDRIATFTYNQCLLEFRLIVVVEFSWLLSNEREISMCWPMGRDLHFSVVVCRLWFLRRPHLLPLLEWEISSWTFFSVSLEVWLSPVWPKWSLSFHYAMTVWHSLHHFHSLHYLWHWHSLQREHTDRHTSRAMTYRFSMSSIPLM